MNNFTIKETPIKDLVIIEPKVFGDERGFFMETYNQESFKELGLTMNFVQDNHSKSKKAFYVDFIFRESILKEN